jgi:hypothetical protein
MPRRQFRVYHQNDAELQPRQHEGDQQVDGEDEEFAHGVDATRIVSTRKTAPHSRVPSYYEFATHRISRSASLR